MRNKCIPVVLLLLLASLFTFANNDNKCDKGRKDNPPDLNGIVIEAETGKPLKDVNVTAYNYNYSKKEKIATSNASGNFTLVDLKPGIYRFVFQKEGFEKVIREKIVLKLNEEYQLNIQMFEQENIYDLMPSPLRLGRE